jgi:phosphomevalonate kinase
VSAADAGVVATAPGKLHLTGEYAVLHGATAVLIAVDRRVIARLADSERGAALSPFLVAVADHVGRAAGPAAAAIAHRIIVDSSALYDRGTKLGLGSSAATTVAAVACALAGAGQAAARPAIHAIARAAHADAQGARGARGSGADIATSTFGGAIAFTAGAVRPLHLPADLTLIPFWTGAAADTAPLVAAIEAARAHRGAVDQALTAIATASTALAAACDAADAGRAIAALDDGARAITALGAAAGVDLIPDAVVRARQALARLGGTAKTCGAAGGDVAIAAIDRAHVTTARVALIEAGCQPLPLDVDPRGVDITRPAA